MTQQVHLKLPPWATDNVVLLNVRLNEHLLIRMLLDTGSKYTIITPAVALRLDLALEQAPRIATVTASRTERVPLINLEQVDVNGLSVTNVKCAVLDLPTALGVDGLLGMSFLKNCKLILDVPNGSLELALE